VRSLLSAARAQVAALLSEQVEQLHALAGALLEHETLSGPQIKARCCCGVRALWCRGVVGGHGVRWGAACTNTAERPAGSAAARSVW
jgi:hypothetical protein